MSDARTTTITDTDRVEWLLRHGTAMQVDGAPIRSREQVDEQIRRSRRQCGRAWGMAHGAVATDDALETPREADTPKPTKSLVHGTLLSRTVELSMISAANRELAIIIGDLRLRRCS